MPYGVRGFDGGGIKAHDLWKSLTKGRLRARTRETIKGIYEEIWIATLYRAKEKVEEG